MNEVGMTKALGQIVTGSASASSKGVEADQLGKTGKDSPASAEKSATTAVQQTPPTKVEASESLESALESVNSHMKSMQRDLQFSLDKELGRTIVKVVDSDSGKTIRQIPEDVFLDLARNLRKDSELQLLDAKS